MFNTFLKRGIEVFRQPDRNPRCYEMSDEERLNKIKEWNNRNVWNDPALTYDDTLAIDVPKNRYYGA
jgi:hypothetical protein